MSDKDKKGSDVDHLMKHMHIGSVRYREFGTPKSTAPVVSNAVPPAAAPAVPPVASVPAATAADEQRPLRPVSAASPLAFTFERLRRQAIATPARKPYLSLDLPERHPVHADGQASLQRQRLLQSVFAELEAHGPLHARSRA